MAETGNLALPLLAAGQAQKHVTVNEALTRLDMLVMLSIRSRDLTAPPASAEEGVRHVVATGATGAWSGQEGKLAVRVNGGWDFVQPSNGWRAYVEDEGREVVFNAGLWLALTAPAGGGGALGLLEFEQALTPGGARGTDGQIPAGALVMGVTARVLETLAGVAAWSLGVADAPVRYGAGLAPSAGTTVSGARGAPLAHFAALPLWVTPEGGAFTGGRIKFAIHYMALPAPAA